MEQYLIMCRSLTHAQRSSRLLERSGIVSTVIRAPQELRKAGCGYALSLYRHFEEAVGILKRNQLINGKLYKMRDDGGYTEVMA